MIPTIKSNIDKTLVRLDDIAKLAPARRRAVLGYGIREMERAGKRIARSGGVFSSRSTGALARSLRGVVLSNTLAVLQVGVKYGLIQDHGGVTKAHFVGPRKGNVTRGVSWIGKKYGRKGRRNTVTGGVLSWIGPGGKRFFSKGHMVGPATIPATNYSWKSYMAARGHIVERIKAEMLGRKS